MNNAMERAAEAAKKIGPILQEFIDKKESGTVAAIIAMLTVGCAQGIRGSKEHRLEYINKIHTMSKDLFRNWNSN